jgi:hypothetical protein
MTRLEKLREFRIPLNTDSYMEIIKLALRNTHKNNVNSLFQNYCRKLSVKITVFLRLSCQQKKAGCNDSSQVWTGSDARLPCPLPFLWAAI